MVQMTEETRKAQRIQYYVCRLANAAHRISTKLSTRTVFLPGQKEKWISTLDYVCGLAHKLGSTLQITRGGVSWAPNKK